MGRPLKIAKSQAVITITNTTAATDLVTTSANFTNLGIIAGMPFVTASNIGGLVAGTLYWILRVVNAGNNSTFTVSATPLNANPTSTPVDLSTASGSIATTVAPVDMYFNNPLGPQWPATNANTYSVVGGNTAQYGKQVLANVGFGVQGTGTQLANTSSNVLVGTGTNFANIANGTIIYAQYGTTGIGANAVIGTGAVTLIGTVANNVGNVTVAVANSTATGNVIGTSGNAQTLVLGGSVIFDTAFGGLSANTPYFVRTIANAAAFTVSATPGGAPQAVTSNSSVTANAIQQQLVLSANAANASTGVNGAGDTFIQVLPEAGYIVRQKGKQKYLVTGTTTGITGACFTANVANTAMQPNTMTITATYANAATVKVQSLSDHTVELFTSTSGTTALPNQTANINNTSPAFATFNNAAAANAAAGQPYPLVQIGNA